MATRSRTDWKLRKDGQYDCRVGRKISRNGKPGQHRFRLGSDLEEAKRRDQLLRQVWERIEELQPDPLWDDDTLEIAGHAARGDGYFHLIRRPEEDVVTYTKRTYRLNKAFPMIGVLPELDYSAAIGLKIIGAMETMQEEDEAEPSASRDDASNRFQELLNGKASPVAGPTLHQAMRKHITWINDEYSRPETGITSWGNTQMKQVGSLIAHHADIPLAQFGQEEIEGVIRYWRQRPYKQGTKNRVTIKSASNYIGALTRFVRWLHRTDPTWKKPDGFDEIKTRVMTLEDEQRVQVTPERLFTLDELVLLFRYATPLDRLLILLGLNCGFGAAESSSLLVEESCLHTAHSERHQEMLDFSSTTEDSFIKRVRRKNNVHGEFILFPSTVTGIEWALQRRKKQPNFGPKARLLLNQNGNPFDKQTKGGNPNRQIPNNFTRLLKRIADDNHEISRLPFKMLRKTGGDLVKRFSNGEVSGVYLCHGQAVVSDNLGDAYTSRPFGKVFHALRKVESYLQPMFEAAGPAPFASQPQAYISQSTINRIHELHKQGASAQQIADEVGKSASTVQRHISKATGPRRTKRPRKTD